MGSQNGKEAGEGSGAQVFCLTPDDDLSVPKARRTESFCYSNFQLLKVCFRFFFCMLAYCISNVGRDRFH